MNVCKRKKCLFALEFLVALILIFIINIMAGIRNDGLEGDEVFSYISATGEGGFKGICYLEDQTWYDADYFRNAVTATGIECFNIKMVTENQIMDTHPPLYYLFLNLICSALEGRYSRWFGIGLNIFFMSWVDVGLYLLIQYFTGNKHLSLIVSTIFCCSYLAISMTLFIRMYVLLMALTLLQSWYHLKTYDNITSVAEYPIKTEKTQKETGSFLLNKEQWKSYGTIALLTIAGGLTHYYFLAYQCLIAAAFIAALFYQKRYKDMCRYISVMIGSAVIYIALYPASIYHIFFKYRGRDAVHKFLKESTMFTEVSSMLSSFNKQLFKGSLPAIILFLLIITIILLIRKNIDQKRLTRLGFLIIPSLIYFYGVSKASPYILMRYICPVAALIYASVIVWAKYLIDAVKSLKIKKAAYIALCTYFFFTVFYFFKTPIKAAYFTERKTVLNNLSKETPYCVYVGDGESYWKMWEDYINFPAFQGLYFIDGHQKAPITDEKLLKQEKLVIYLDNTLEPEDIFAYLQTYLPLQQYEIQYKANYTYIILGQ